MKYSKSKSVSFPRVHFSRATTAAFMFALVAAVSGNALAEKVNLNTANAETIQYIPGIGLSKATQIVEQREKLGKFSNMDEVDAVPGIGERTMIDVRKYGSLDSGVSELTEEMKASQPTRSEVSAEPVAPSNAS